MSFRDLPPDVRDLPLVEPTLVADVLDLVVSEADRVAGALAVLMCDDEDRLVLPVVVTELEPEASVAQRARGLCTIVSAMGGVGWVLVAIARPEGLSITADDVTWAEAARQACAGEVGLLGVHVITLAGSRPVPAVGIAS